MLKSSFVNDFLKDLNDGNDIDKYLFETFFLRDEGFNSYSIKSDSINSLGKFIHSIDGIVSIDEDSHVISTFLYDCDKYILKTKFNGDLIESIVYEKYDINKEQMVLTIEYDGTSYYGMQKLENSDLKTIQGELELALFRMLNEEIEVIISSRTDRGVHAIGQKVQIPSRGIPGKNYIKALNKLLPKDIRIKDAYTRSQLFNVRYDVVSKTYYYLINENEFSCFKNNYCLYEKINDKERLKEELSSLIGTHDFRAFCKGEKENTIRTIYSASYTVNDGVIKIEIKGSGFLHNMIRFIVGMLIYIDKTKRTTIKDLIEKKDKSLTMKIASASGLYLEKIEY